MEFKDKTITCCDCHEDFTFTAGEQEFYQMKGLIVNVKYFCRFLVKKIVGFW